MKSILGEPFDVLRKKTFKQKRITNAQEEKANRRNLWKESLKSLLALVLIFMVLLMVEAFFLTRYTVKQSFMEPSLRNGSQVWLVREGLIKLPYHYGDKVLVDLRHLVQTDLFPTQTSTLKHQESVYRIIAKPYDTFEIKMGQIYVNQKPIVEPYLDHSRTEVDQLKYQNLVLGEDDYMVLGDARLEAIDSRFFGPVNRKEILGKIFP